MTSAPVSPPARRERACRRSRRRDAARACGARGAAARGRRSCATRDRARSPRARRSDARATIATLRTAPRAPIADAAHEARASPSVAAAATGRSPTSASSSATLRASSLGTPRAREPTARVALERLAERPRVQERDAGDAHPTPSARCERAACDSALTRSPRGAVRLAIADLHRRLGQRGPRELLDDVVERVALDRRCGRPRG